MTLYEVIQALLLNQQRQEEEPKETTPDWYEEELIAFRRAYTWLGGN